MMKIENYEKAIIHDGERYEVNAVILGEAENIATCDTLPQAMTIADEQFDPTCENGYCHITISKTVKVKEYYNAV